MRLFIFTLSMTSSTRDLSKPRIIGLPAWFTLNLKASYAFNPNLTVQAGIDNLLDTKYRTFGSGINAMGRNINVTLRTTF